MPEHRRCCLVLLVALFAGMTLETGHVSKSGCQGDSIELYHISFNTNFALVSLYKRDVQIAMWSMQNTVLNTTFLDGYINKIVLDINGNIRIRELHMSDEANYTIKIEKRNESYAYKVQLVVLVAPTTNCKPKITRVGNVLTVHLEAKWCGRPVPSVHWLNHSGIVFEETKAVKLRPGKACIYHACIEGEALTCAKSPKLSEYCSVFIVDEGQPLSDQGAATLRAYTEQEQLSPGQEGAETIKQNTVQGIDLSQSDMTRGIFLALVICLPLVIVIIIIFGLCLVRWRRIENRKPDPGNRGMQNRKPDPGNQELCLLKPEEESSELCLLKPEEESSDQSSPGVWRKSLITHTLDNFIATLATLHNKGDERHDWQLRISNGLDI